MVSDSVRFISTALETCGVAVKIGTSQLDPKALNIFFGVGPGLPLSLIETLQTEAFWSKIVKIRNSNIFSETS